MPSVSVFTFFFVCSVGTYKSEAVPFVGVVLCVRLATSCQEPSVFSGLFCVFGWHLPVNSRSFSRVCFVCSVGTFLSEAVCFLGVVLCVRLAPSSQKPSVRLEPTCQKPSVFSGLFCVFGWYTCHP